MASSLNGHCSENPQTVHIAGGGLAGSEAAWQLAERGHDVVLHEMRPVRGTAAHKTDRLAELVLLQHLQEHRDLQRARPAQGRDAPARLA